MIIILTILSLINSILSFKRTQQAGCIPITKDGLVILISSRKHDNFILPKGKVEKNETPIMAAERETYEEAGARGKVFKKPVLVYKKISWFLMIVEDIQYEYMETYRDRIFIPLDSVLYIKDIKIKRDVKFVLAKLLKKKSLLKIDDSDNE
ncbi:Diphosphoinositol polyphosphate phosphohydrolase 2 [Dictyocoela muelleri]|nr:Diphosphoinositol polyphosphate phosphohydrolase 2 [Dictyocoela muelleri]